MTWFILEEMVHSKVNSLLSAFTTFDLSFFIELKFGLQLDTDTAVILTITALNAACF